MGNEGTAVSIPGCPAAGEALPPEAYLLPAAEVARRLLGCFLMSRCGGAQTAGRIVETEAYPGPEDPACHASAAIGRTARNDPLFGPPGTAYVHLNYGVHWCLNAVTGPEGYPAGVLIRAVEPVRGVDRMRERRGGRRELTNGPGRLTRALGIGPEIQRHPLQEPPVWIVEGQAPESIVVATRIGISRAVDAPLRFYDAASSWVSRR